MKFRKKPVEIEASLWMRAGDHPKVISPPSHCLISSDMRCEHCGEASGKHGEVITLESGQSAHLVCPGDWIICGVKGEFYPCKPDIFAATYESAETATRDNSKNLCSCGLDDLKEGCVAVEVIARVIAAINGLLEIGKRNLSNPKYDGYFNELRSVLVMLKGENNGQK